MTWRDEFDEDNDAADDDAGADADAEECGRWRNGRLDPQCTKAGSEECDWVCPIGLERKHWP
jgi:hypothetical protein